MSPHTSSIFYSRAQSISRLRPSQSAEDSSPALAPATTTQAELENARQKASSPPPLFAYAKDIRAFEHDRQRVKKAADLVKMRARKGQVQVHGWTTRFHAAAATKGSSMSPSKSLTEDDLDVSPVVASSDSKIQAGPSGTFVSEPLREVKLSELVVTRKPRKVKEGDFEVVPHIRSVIVLDDTTADDFSLDEPWEHINRIDGEEVTDKKHTSYAKVVALSK